VGVAGEKAPEASKDGAEGNAKAVTEETPTPKENVEKDG
jgi:hypothetical protein